MHSNFVQYITKAQTKKNLVHPVLKRVCTEPTKKKRGTAMFGVGKAEKIANFQVCDVNGKRWTLLLSKELSGKILKDL